MVRAVSFRATVVIPRGKLDEEAIPGLVKQLKDLSLTSHRVESAAKISELCESEIRERAIQAAKEAAADLIKRKALGIHGGTPQVTSHSSKVACKICKLKRVPAPPSRLLS